VVGERSWLTCSPSPPIKMLRLLRAREQLIAGWLDLGSAMGPTQVDEITGLGGQRRRRRASNCIDCGAISAKAVA
jgi:hypothetical protein